MSKPFVAGQTAYRCRITSASGFVEKQNTVEARGLRPSLWFGRPWYGMIMPQTSGYHKGHGWGHTPEEAREYAVQGLRDREKRLERDLEKVREMLRKVVQGE